MRLLVAEDEQTLARAIKEGLEGESYAVDLAFDGEEGYNSASNDDYDLIILDVMMPVMNGYEATKAIRASAHPRAKSIPIIAVTADVFSEDVARALACGMDDCISKPIDYRKLMEALSRYTKQKGAGNL